MSPDSASWLDACFGGGTDPDRQALFTRTSAGWQSVTFRELRFEAESLARRVAGRTEPGSTVLLCMKPSGEWVSAFLGALLGGAVVAPVAPAVTEDELKQRIELLSPALAVVDSHDAGRQQLAAVAPHLPVLPVRSRETGPVDLPQREMDGSAVLMTTAGTTGEPKVVDLSLANVAYVVDTLADLQGAADDDIWLSVLPLHHMLELACVLLPALRTGGKVLFADSIMPDELFSHIGEHGVTRMMTVPALLTMLARRVSGRPPSLRSLYCGGAPLDREVQDKLEAMGIDVFAGYGLTETSPTISVNHPGARRSGSVGRPLPGTDVHIDEASGEISVKGPGLMRGYLGDTDGVSSDGWFATGDTGSIDEDGYLYVTGRIKNLIVLPSGQNVAPEEVEQALARCDDFVEVCVTGKNAVCAVVVPTGPDLSLAQCEAAVARACSGLSAYKRPNLVLTVQGELPKSAKKTVDRARTLELAQGRGAR